MLRIATCQMTSGPDTAANLQTAEMLIRRAAREGANLVVLPELFSLVRSLLDITKISTVFFSF